MAQVTSFDKVTIGFDKHKSHKILVDKNQDPGHSVAVLICLWFGFCIDENESLQKSVWMSGLPGTH